MFRKNMKALVYALLLGSLLLSSACTGGASYTIPTAIQTVWVTPVITQIVATLPTRTPTIAPTSTPAPTITPLWDPLAVPIYYPITGCAASRLHVGDMAFVAFTNPNVRIRLSKDIAYDPGVREAVSGEQLQVVDGPWCSNHIILWGVYMVSDKLVGYLQEGDGNVYWLLPLSPTVPTPKKRH